MHLMDLEKMNKKTLRKLEKLGIATIADLLTHFPRDYEDRRTICSLGDARAHVALNKHVLTKAKVIRKEKLHKNKFSLLRVCLANTESRQIQACLISYNPALHWMFKENAIMYFWVKWSLSRNVVLESSNFEVVLSNFKVPEKGCILPVYSLTEGLNQRKLRYWVREALDKVSFRETLREDFILKHGLFSKKNAYENIHFPTSFSSLKLALKRFKYYELFSFSLQMVLKKQFLSKKRSGVLYHVNTTPDLVEMLKTKLPFALGCSQKKVWNDVLQDLLSSKVIMNRIIQGDVGSGKTVVALLALLFVVQNGGQGVLMCPTEILAMQHYNNFRKWLQNMPVDVGLCTGSLSASERREALNAMRSGRWKLIVGTHSLCSDDVRYSSLRLVVIDEQHKFGVETRAQLLSKGEDPDVLVLSATPIPRTLALTLFGGLDISVMGSPEWKRTSVQSACVFSEKERKAAYYLARKEVLNGRQVFVVAPAIEDSEKIPSLVSVHSLFLEISEKVFPDMNVKMLHGRCSSQEQESLLSSFARGQFQVMLATGILEVGIDIPNASCIIIENAERFGLAQLHQLRGRVGRGCSNAHCFFVALDAKEEAQERLRFMEMHDNGFDLAEKDLQLRGHGQFLGKQQSGLRHFKVADLAQDQNLLLLAGNDALSLVKEDPELRLDKNRMFSNVYKKFRIKYQHYLGH